MERLEQVDTLTGEQYVTWLCPVCGRREREQGERTRILDYGDGPTPEDAARYAEMAETPAGRLELAAELRRQPLHDRIYIDQAGLLALAHELGAEGIGPPIRIEFS